MSSFSAPRDPFRRSSFGSGGNRPRALVPTIAVLVVLLALIAVSTNFWTEWLWFEAIEFRNVFTTTLLTRVVLFAVFGLLMAIVVFANLMIAHRFRPKYRAMSAEQQSLDRYRDLVDPHRRLFAVIIAAVVGLFAGSSASGQWSTYLQWQNSTDFGRPDPQFGIDISFFVFDYPWYRFLLSFGFALITVALIAAVAGHYLYGSIRLQTPGQKVVSAAQIHISVLLGLFVALKAVAYWFDRYGLVLGSHRISGQGFTGLTFTDANAQLPAKTILMIIAATCALLFFANVIRRTWLLPGLGVGLLALSAVLLGWAWPAVIQQIQVRPNEPDREREYIEKNIAATRAAYDVADADVVSYSAETDVSPGQLADDAETIPGIRLIDPTIVGETFEQLQQIRGFYSFPAVMDVDRYDLESGEQNQDSVVAVREINLDGVAVDQRNWNNDHTVYTHGFGMVAAYGNRRGEEGNPQWIEQNIPPKGELGDYEPRVYFGEQSPEYSIVGREKGEDAIEFDRPDGGADDDGTTYTYTGDGGVGVGSLFRKLLYATKFRDANLLLSGRVNSESRILYDRQPYERVQKVAPWLTLDSDPYPAVVDGRIVWIVDGYSMTDAYPFSQRVQVDDATSDSLSVNPNIVGPPSAQANYVRNSVKAVVDAYSGAVTLYAWDEQDPLLRTWMKAFPDSVQPREEMPEELLDHVRYPQDLFKMQREILAQYHVEDSDTFYQGSERWRIPTDPNDERAKQPVYYLSVRMPEEEEPSFSLTSTYIYFNRENLAAFAAVNADARSDDYGKITVLEVDSATQIDGPSQIANKMGSDNVVADELLPFTRGDNLVRRGNLLTLPVGGGLLYVQPVYVEREQESAYPLLRLVIVSFGGRIAVASSLQDALDQVFEGDSGAETGEDGGAEGETPPEEGETPPDDATPPGDGGPAEPLPADVQAVLDEANAAFDEADEALRSGDLAGYQEGVQRGRELLEELVTSGGGGGDAGGAGADAGADEPANGGAEPAEGDQQGGQGG